MGPQPCPLPCQSTNEADSDKPISLPSSSNSSLYSQPSLPSIPSLTPPSQQPSAATRHHCLSTLRGHSSSVFSIFLAGKHLYSGSATSEIRFWSRRPSNEETSSENLVLTGNSAVKSLIVSNGKLFSAHQDHKIRVWKIDSEKSGCIATLPTLGDRVTRFFSMKNYVKVGRHRKCTWVHHVDAISALALSEDGDHLYSASWDRTFKVWRTSDFKCLESTWNAHDDAINALTVSKDGVVYTGSADKKIKVWKKDEKRHKHVSTLEKHRSAVNALALSTDGSVLYSGACDRSIIVWEREGEASGGEMAVAGALRGHNKAILCLVVVSDLVCSGSADKTVRIWKRGVIGKSSRRSSSGYSCLAVFEGHTSPVKCLTATVDNASATSFLVYSGSLDCDIKVWQICVS